MHLLPTRCPTWTPRLPPLTIDPRDVLAEIVLSRTSTPDARTAAAHALDRSSTFMPGLGFWELRAEEARQIFGETA